MTHFYMMGCPEFPYTKLGFSAHPVIRLNQIQTGNPYKLYMVSYLMKDGEVFENFVHRVFEAKKVRGEWYDLDEKDLDLLHSNAANCEIDCDCRGCTEQLATPSMATVW